MRGGGITSWLVLVASLNACGSDDDAPSEMASFSAQPGGESENADDCTGTVTGGPHPGPLTCSVRVNYFAEPSFAASEGDVTVLTISGGLVDDTGGISQNLIVRGQPMVQTYDELVLEPREGLVRTGSVGTLEFQDRNESTLFFRDTGSVTLTAVGPAPFSAGSFMVSGSAEWELTGLFSETVEATIAITFVDQY
jgi:hypothetical protein